VVPQHENELAGSPLIPRQSETRLRLSEAGFAFQGVERFARAAAASVKTNFESTMGWP
jgi:hypothetical protein